MDVEFLYMTFREFGLAHSQVEFSRVWLGRSARYYSHLIAEDKQPGLATLIALRWRITRVAEGLPTGAFRDQLMSLDAALAEGIELRSILDVRKKQGAPKHSLPSRT